MSINQSEAKNALGVFISSIHKSLRTSFWYRVYDHCSTDPDGVEIPNPNSVNNDERREAIEKKKILGDLYLMSFRSQTGLSQDVYIELLVNAGLLKKNTTSEGYRVLLSKWKKYFSEIDIDAEFEGSVFFKSVCGNSKRYFIRIGPKQSEYNQNVRVQINAGKYAPPRIQNIRNLRQSLANAIDDGQENPTEMDRATVRQVTDTAVNAHFALLRNKTPKVHVAEEHAVAQYMRLRPGMMRLLMEHWVEKNHQDSAKIEHNFKRVPNLQSRANFVAGARHAANNSLIKKRVAEVDLQTGRGQYKKGRIN